MSAIGVPLTGGRVTPGVVRIGDTVRRPQGSKTVFVERLLRHLEAAHFDGAPRALGRDTRGRAVTRWITGDVPSELADDHSNAVLTAAAHLIARYHDATVPLAADADADADADAEAEAEVVCHNDLSPCNAVFRAGLPVALIDFDTAAPGTRAHDLGYAAWLWLDLGGNVAASAQARRLELFLTAYGPRCPSQIEVAHAVLARQRALAHDTVTCRSATARWADHCYDWTARHFDILCGA